MFKRLFSLLFSRRCAHIALLAGAFSAGGAALYHIADTAVFVYKAQVVDAVVTDVRQKPFESTWEALSHGNLSMAEDTSYLPTVRFTLPNGVRVTRELQQPDNRDYAAGEQLSLLTYPNDPTAACPYRFKFLWGGDCVRMVYALILLLLARLLRGKGKRRRPAAAAPMAPNRPQPAPPAEKAPAKKKAPAKPRAKKTAAKADGTSTPRKPRSRKKKSEEA